MFYLNVLTPERIPEFFIPPKFSRQRKPGTSSVSRAAGEGGPAHPGSWARLGQELAGPTDGESTDWDPKSRAALSLPHLARARTPYGFCRLLESPHTRRKESLFHSRPDPIGVPFPGALPALSLPGMVPLGQCLAKESTATLGASGILRLRADYCSERQRLRLRLLSLEGMYEQYSDCQAIGCCLSLQLEPGKGQKQRSALIRRSRNPIFNQDFDFHGISWQQLHCTFLKIKVINKVSRMKRDAVLGVCQLCLASVLPL
ncbi:C2 calcium-dependent domain-containing protein 4A [Heterodontus francisci]|uniref:C2 calcium-dependent domain-containing protein 4A n=1 Tax=Heterodontus francisci TaxID=7792 RepID=UPI00355C6560